MRFGLRISILVAVLAATATAQTFRGAIHGSVEDPTGGMVANAQVKATDTATGVEHATVTTSGGEFTFQDIPLGTYQVTVTASGFNKATFDKVPVTAGSIYTLPVKLSMGAEATTVEVSAAALTVDTTSATQTMTISDTSVQDTPLNGRDFSQLISVSPGYGGYSVGGFGSLNGTRANQMNWQIDGTDNNDMWHNIPAVNQGGVSGIAGVIMPIDAVQDFSAQTQSNAENGRNAGGIVNVVIKSGANQVHGSAYYYNRNGAYSANSPFYIATPEFPKAPPLTNQNVGGVIGGPIIKNKLFWFVGFEYQTYKLGLSGLSTEPSIAWANQAVALMNQYGVAVNPLSQTLLTTLWPSSVANLPATLNNYFSPVAGTGYSYNGVAKIDWTINAKNTLSAHWFAGQGSQTQPPGLSLALATASSNLGYYFETAPLHVQNYNVVLNSVLTPTLTNQVLAGVSYFQQSFHDANNTFNMKALGLWLSPDALINGNPIFGASNIGISGFGQVGITPPEGRQDVTGHLTDVLSWSKGKHQFRFGGEYRDGHVDEYYYRRSLGSFTFDGTQGPWAGTCASTDPTCALADYLAGYVSSSSIAVGHAERAVVSHGYSLFTQDNWQVTRNLNLTLGLRYEYFGPLHNGDKNLAVWIPGQGFKIQGADISSIFPADHNNFAPRAGFAWNPYGNGDMVVRGSFGVFYDQINMNPFLDFRPPISGADGLQDNPVGPNPVSNYSLNNYQWAAGQYIFPGVATCPTLSGCNQTFNVYSVNQNFRTPYFYNYNLQLEKAIGDKMVFQFGYVGSAAHKLNVMLNINQNLAFNAAYPDIGSVLQLNSNGTSNYNALQTVLKMNSWHGLTGQFSYTWAHAIDQVTEYRGVIPFDSFNIALDKGNSDFDTRQLFVGYLVYTIPGSSKGPEMLTHGWQLAGNVNFHTGQPFNFNAGTQRPGMNVVCDPFAGVSHSFSAALGGEQWVNPACFVPAVGAGNLARNRYYGPGFSDVDISVIKNIPIKERLTVQIRAEMFNIFNRINLASGAGSVGSNGFVSDTIGDFNGSPGIGPGEPFNMQLAGKIIF
ncbi:MAG TPA: TonB-dependent receptor [Candidatus Limnocylindrales bacterium]|nr:TonB-dependent receptor [Candidatus Limnocylindrales bacterium]